MEDQNTVNKYLDEAIKETDNRDTLISWLMIKFHFTPEWADIALNKWLSKEYDGKKADIAIQYLEKITELQRDRERKLEDAYAWFSKLSPSHTD